MAENVLSGLTVALRALPAEAITWTRKAHRLGWRGWRDESDPGKPGLISRLSQTAIGSTTGQVTGTLPPYNFSARRNRLGAHNIARNRARAADRNRRRKSPYNATGAMRATLMRRLPKIRTSSGDMVSTFDLSTNVMALLRTKHGVASARWEPFVSTYIMTVYKDSVARTGRYQMQVSRTLHRRVITKTGTNMAGEWLAWRRPELELVARTVEAALTQIVRTSVFTANGRIRSRFADRLPEGIIP